MGQNASAPAARQRRHLRPVPVYLHGLLEELTGLQLDECLLPELPILARLIWPERRGNASVKVDYVLFARDRSRVLLVELKTDAGSRREAQDEYLARAVQVGFAQIVEGVLDIVRATTAHQKYHHLLHALAEQGCVRLPPNLADFVHPRPRQGLRRLQSLIEVTVGPGEYEVEVVYVQPEPGEGGPGRVIAFEDVAAYVERFDDPVSAAFSAHLRRWRTPAGAVRPGLALTA